MPVDGDSVQLPDDIDIRRANLNKTMDSDIGTTVAGVTDVQNTILEEERAQTMNDIVAERRLISWERELLSRERQLLERERLALQNSSVRRANIRPKDVVDVIPEFDPAKTSSLTAAQWVARVNVIAKSYEWDNFTIVTHSATKLRGAARTWYNSSIDDLSDWDEFCHALIKGFPSTTNEADIHRELARRKRRKDEAVEEYFYDVIAIARKINLSDAAVIKYVINGLGNSELSNTLRMMDYDDPQHLLRKLRQYEDGATSDRPRIERRMQQSISVQPTELPKAIADRRMQEQGTCYNCGRKGHISRSCPDRDKGPKCFGCRKYGHKANNCPEKERWTNVNFADEEEHEFQRTVMVNGHQCLALFDTGSCASLIRERKSTEIGLPICKKYRVLVGLGGHTIRCTGETVLDINLDGRRCLVNAVVVPNYCTKFDVVLGRKFLSSEMGWSMKPRDSRDELEEELQPMMHTECEVTGAGADVCEDLPATVVRNNMIDKCVLVSKQQKTRSDVRMKIEAKSEKRNYKMSHVDAPSRVQVGLVDDVDVNEKVEASLAAAQAMDPEIRQIREKMKTQMRDAVP